MEETRYDNMDELQQTAIDELYAQEHLAAQDSPVDQESPENPDAAETADSPADDAASSGSTDRLMRSLVDDDEVDEMSVASLRQMLEAAPRWILSEWKMLLLCLVGIFLYITNGYQAQMEMMQESELEAELKDWRYRCITRVGELTQLCRQSRLEQMLREQGDSTLVPSKEAPFVIHVKE